MKIKIFIFLILILIFIFIKNYEIKINENTKVITDYIGTEDNDSKIEEILKSEVIFEEIKIKRKDFNLLNIKNDFSFYSKKNSFELKHIKNRIKFDNKTKYNFFKDFEIDLEELWENKKKFIRLDPEKIYFSGLLNEKNKKTAYLYFYENLITVEENDYLGDKKVLKIFKDGVLLINSENQFEVIL